MLKLKVAIPMYNSFYLLSVRSSFFLVIFVNQWVIYFLLFSLNESRHAYETVFSAVQILAFMLSNILYLFS